MFQNDALNAIERFHFKNISIDFVDSRRAFDLDGAGFEGTNDLMIFFALIEEKMWRLYLTVMVLSSLV